MAPSRAKSSSAGVWILGLLALWLIVAVIEFVASHWLLFVATGSFGGGLMWFVRRQSRIARDAALADARARAQADEEARQQSVAAQRRAIAAAVEAEARAWRDVPLALGRFAVVAQAVPDEGKRSVTRFLANLHAFREADLPELEALVERVQHVAPQKIVVDVAQADAVRLKLALEELRVKVKIVEGVPARSSEGRPRRQGIPERVRNEVWRRDDGRCVDCGSRERLEFDHIVPVSKGGSNTARNLELRCERCNRVKGAKI